MARSRIVTGLEKLMSDLPKLMIQRSLAEDAQMKKLSIQATEGYLKEAANFTTEAQFDAAAASMMDELSPYGNDPTIAMAGNNAFRAMGRLRDNFVNKQEAVIDFNTNFAKAKELNQLDTTSGMQEVYNSISTTLEAKKQYFNSTEYSAYQTKMEDLGELIKVKSLTNYLDDLSVGARDEYGQLIVEPGIQSGSSKLQMVNELSKVGMISNAAAMKQLLEISEDINAGTMGAIMNSGAKDMKILGRELQAFSYDSLPSAYTDKFLIDFKKSLFTEGELTTDNVVFVRDNLRGTLENIIGEDDPKKAFSRFLDDLPGEYGKGLDGVVNYITQQRGKHPDKSTQEIVADIIDTHGVDFFGADPKRVAQEAHFAKVLNLYMKTGDMMDEFLLASTNNTVDSSISGYTNALLNYGKQEEEDETKGRKRVKASTLPSPFIQSTTQPIGVLAPPRTVGGTPPSQQTAAGQSIIKGQSNILSLVKTIAEKQRTTSIPSTQPKVTTKPLPSLGKALAQDKSPEAIAKRKEAERVADIRVSVSAQEPDQDDMSYIESIDSKQLRKIGIWSDKNVTRKLKTEAKKELNARIKQLQSMRGDVDSAMVDEEMPKLRKLLKEFNNAGVNKISKSMLEYMYMLNASQYDGVDDFIASLSDGKIGVE